MKISEIEKLLKLKLLTKSEYEDKKIDGCYIGDLLSRVMSKASENNIWITIMNNVNIVAVATLTEPACIILAEDVKLTSEVAEKADENDVVIFSSSKTAYELACIIGNEIS